MIFQNPMTCLNPVYTVGNQLIEALKAHDKSISKEDAAKRAMEMDLSWALRASMSWWASTMWRNG